MLAVRRQYHPAHVNVMRVLALVVLAGLAGGGCTTGTVPLRSVHNVNSMVLSIQDKSDTKVVLGSESSSSRIGKEAAVNSGLLSLAIADGVIMATGHKDRAQAIHSQQSTNFSEPSILEQVIETQLALAGISYTNAEQKPKLAIDLKSVNFREVERGFWEVHLSVSAEIVNSSGETAWSVSVVGNSATLRRWNDFTNQPDLYVKDFREAATDAARQLVRGPIRK